MLLLQVAIKKVLQDKRFKNRELQIMKMTRHPNVVALKHCFYSNTEKDEVRGPSPRGGAVAWTRVHAQNPLTLTTRASTWCNRTPRLGALLKPGDDVRQGSHPGRALHPLCTGEKCAWAQGLCLYNNACGTGAGDLLVGNKKEHNHALRRCT